MIGCDYCFGQVLEIYQLENVVLVQIYLNSLFVIVNLGVKYQYGCCVVFSKDDFNICVIIV